MGRENFSFRVVQDGIDSSVRPCVHAQNASGVLGKFPGEKFSCPFGSSEENRMCPVTFSASVDDAEKTISIRASNTEEALCDYVYWNILRFN